MDAEATPADDRAAQALREDFLLDDTNAHLNHGSFGATPLPVLRRQQELRDELEASPSDFISRTRAERLTAVAVQVAAFAGVADPSRIVFVQNVLSAVNGIAWSLPLSPDEEIVTTSHEYGHVLATLREITRRRGARLTVVDLPWPAVSAADIVERISAAFGARTRALVVSEITSPSAIRLPVGELVRLARERGIVTIVDGAHGPGQLPLALDHLGADLYAGNAHKWLGAPKGAAFLYASESAQQWVRPPLVTEGWADSRPSRFRAGFDWQGTGDPTAVYSIPAAIAYQTEHDWPQVIDRCTRLADDTRDRLIAEADCFPVAPAELEAPQLRTVGFDHPEPERLVPELFDRHRVEVVQHVLQGVATLRFSIAGYVTSDDCHRLVTGMRDLCG